MTEASHAVHLLATKTLSLAFSHEGHEIILWPLNLWGMTHGGGKAFIFSCLCFPLYFSYWFSIINERPCCYTTVSLRLYSHLLWRIHECSNRSSCKHWHLEAAAAQEHFCFTKVLIKKTSTPLCILSLWWSWVWRHFKGSQAKNNHVDYCYCTFLGPQVQI